VARYLGLGRQPPTIQAIFQILSSKEVTAAAGAQSEDDTKRIRLCISDGVHSSTMVLLVLNTSDRIPENNCVMQVISPDDSIGRVNTITHVKDGKFIWVIRNYKVLSHHTEPIGNPEKFQPSQRLLADTNKDERTPDRPAHAGPQADSGPGQPPSKRPRETGVTPRPNSSNGASAGQPSVRRQLFQDAIDIRDGGKMQPTHLIKDLNPYQNKFKIKARVVKKSDLRTWSNSGGQGKVFDVTLKDTSGEIKATGFNEMADKFHPLFEDEKVYLVETASIKPANMNFNKTGHNYELSFHQGTQVTLCMESNSREVPKVQHNLKTIHEINEGDDNKDAIDFVGVVIDVGEVINFTARSGKELTKREVRAVDDSGGGLSEITITFWGEQAENFDSTNLHKVVLARRASVGEWQNRKNLSVSFSGTAVVDPPACDEADRLRDWFSRENGDGNRVAERLGHSGSSAQSNGLSSTGTVATLADIKAVSVGMETSQMFTIEAHFTNVLLDKLMYKACPVCKKKVVEVSSSVRCEKCNKTLESEEVDFRYMAQATLTDITDYHYVTLWNDAGEAAFGCPAKELRRLEEEEHDTFVKRVNGIKYRLFQFNVKAVNDSYQNERRLKLQVNGLQPVDRADQKRLQRMRAEIDIIQRER